MSARTSLVGSPRTPNSGAAPLSAAFKVASVEIADLRDRGIKVMRGPEGKHRRLVVPRPPRCDPHQHMGKRVFGRLVAEPLGSLSRRLGVAGTALGDRSPNALVDPHLVETGLRWQRR